MAIDAFTKSQMDRADKANEAFSLALEMLAHFYHEYEYGPECFEVPEDREGYLGHAVELNDHAEDSISKLLHEFYPRSMQAIRSIDPKTWEDRIETLMARQPADEGSRPA